MCHCCPLPCQPLIVHNRPLNPVLGETFYGVWPAPASNPSRGATSLLVEQVSHHPPITAYIIDNPSKALRLTGHNGQKTSFSSGSIIVKQIGHAVLTVGTNKPESERETYLITLPRLRIDGLWYGSPYIELADTSHIVGGGHITTIEFKGKGYFSGKSHTFKSTTVPLPGQGGAGPREIVVEGTWHENSKYVKGGSGSFHDVHEQKELVVPLEWSSELGEYETRHLWSLVAKGIREGDFEIASREKSRIEVMILLSSSSLNLESDTLAEQNEQRQRRKDEQAEGTTWQLKHFEHVDHDPTCALPSDVSSFHFSSFFQSSRSCEYTLTIYSLSFLNMCANYDTRHSLHGVLNPKLINPSNGRIDKLTGTNSKIYISRRTPQK